MLYLTTSAGNCSSNEIFDNQTRSIRCFVRNTAGAIRPSGLKTWATNDNTPYFADTRNSGSNTQQNKLACDFIKDQWPWLLPHHRRRMSTYHMHGFQAGLCPEQPCCYLLTSLNKIQILQNGDQVNTLINLAAQL